HSSRLASPHFPSFPTRRSSDLASPFSLSQISAVRLPAPFSICRSSKFTHGLLTPPTKYSKSGSSPLITSSHGSYQTNSFATCSQHAAGFFFESLSSFSNAFLLL